MTLQQWLRLKRGDLVRRQDQPGGCFQVLSVRPGRNGIPAIMFGDHRVSNDFSEWIQVNEKDQPIDSDGTILQEQCRLCHGQSHNMLGCPHCGGAGIEPLNLKESVFTLRLFYPNDEHGHEHMLIEADSPQLSREQVVELLERVLSFVKSEGQDDPYPTLQHRGSTRVN